MKEKIQVKIINSDSFTVPPFEISNSSTTNKKAREFLDDLSYDKIRSLIRDGILVLNKKESTSGSEVYDLIY